MATNLAIKFGYFDISILSISLISTFFSNFVLFLSNFVLFFQILYFFSNFVLFSNFELFSKIFRLCKENYNIFGNHKKLTISCFLCLFLFLCVPVITRKYLHRPKNQHQIWFFTHLGHIFGQIKYLFSPCIKKWKNLKIFRLSIFSP